VVCNLVPSLRTTNQPFVTDEERAIVNAISEAPVTSDNKLKKKCKFIAFTDDKKLSQEQSALLIS
jgi:hypothetical protein